MCNLIGSPHPPQAPPGSNVSLLPPPLFSWEPGWRPTPPLLWWPFWAVLEVHLIPSLLRLELKSFPDSQVCFPVGDTKISEYHVEIQAWPSGSDEH